MNVQGKSYSLTKGEKILIVIAGIAGLALLGIGSIFTFYGASYLLRKRTFENVNQTELKPTDSQIQNQSSQNLNSPLTGRKILNQLKKSILDITEELKPIDELQSIEYFAVFHSGSIIFPIRYENIIASENQILREVFASAIEASFENVKLDNEQERDLDKRVTWNVIAKDNNGTFHAVIGRRTLSLQSNQITGSELKDFYRNVDSKDKDQLKEIISKKMKT